MSKIPYLSFDHFVLRTPLFPVQFYKSLTSGNLVKDASLKQAFANKIVKEAIFLASPSFYFEIEKWTKGELDKKKEAKLKLSFLKYLARMSSRCTPFGLFAGCTLGAFSGKTSLDLESLDKHTRYTRPDMNYLVALSQDLGKLSHIKQQLTYFPNSSLYSVGKQLRYIEYFYVDSRRQHHIVEIDNSPYLKKILKKASHGASLQVLANELVDETISLEEAQIFLDELLESQVLTSALEPSVSGPPFIEQILDVLQQLKGCENEIKFLEEIYQNFYDLDNRLGNDAAQYLKLSEHLKKNPTSFELKFLFQTDLELSTKNCELSEGHLSQIKKALILFNKITAPLPENNLSRFKDAFYQRYEEREMPLCHVLDVETGIGYLQNTGSGDINPLVDDLILPIAENPYAESEVKLNKVYRSLMKKLVKAQNSKEQVITLYDSDFQDLSANWDDLPDTLSSMVELVKENDDVKIQISGCGGSSAANLLGRFCHKGSAITSFTKTITAKEEVMQPDKILAEIVHLPEARVGNILMRPNFREFEIPYLAQSNLALNKQIPLEDLYLSVRNDRIVLRSKKYNKEIIPHLTNAHNYSVNSLPIYHFLCDLQTQGLRTGISFSFGPLHPLFDFFPRVEYGNLILQEAKWRIKKDDIKTLINAKSDEAQLKKAVNKLKKTKAIPQYAKLSDNDNELLINFNNSTSVRMLLEIVKNREEFILKEFLHHQDGPVSSQDGHYANQIVISYYNQKKFGNSSAVTQKTQYATT